MLLPSVEVTGGPLPNAFCDTIFENNELTKEGMNAARLWAQSINGRTSQNVDSDGKRFNIAISMYNDRSDDVSHYVLSKPSQEQLTFIKEAIGVCVNHIDYLLQGQVQKYQALCNKIHPTS